MNDFLSLLADRALAPAPAVRPRLPSLYEGSAAAAPIVAPVSVEVDRSAPSRAFIDRPVVQPDPRPAEPIAAIQVVEKTRLHETTSTLEVIRERRSEVPADANQKAERREWEPVVRDTRRDVPPAIQPLDATASRAPGLARSAQPIETRAVSTPAPATKQPLPTHAVPDPRKPREDTTTNRVAAQTPLSILASPTPSVRHAESLSAQLKAPRPATSLATVAPPTASADPPSVHVTIGRVEIRAVLPELVAHSPQAATPRSGLSLDDYLKRDAGGAR